MAKKVIFWLKLNSGCNKYIRKIEKIKYLNFQTKIFFRIKTILKKF